MIILFLLLSFAKATSQGDFVYLYSLNIHSADNISSNLTGEWKSISKSGKVEKIWIQTESACENLKFEKKISHEELCTNEKYISDGCCADTLIYSLTTLDKKNGKTKTLELPAFLIKSPEKIKATNALEFKVPDKMDANCFTHSGEDPYVCNFTFLGEVYKVYDERDAKKKKWQLILEFKGKKFVIYNCNSMSVLEEFYNCYDGGNIGSLVWIGDLNSDGVMDFLHNINEKYSWAQTTYVFTSKKADQNLSWEKSGKSLYLGSE